MMKKLLFAGILILAISGLALAQDFPKYELFGGYSYMRSDLDSTTSWLGSYSNSDGSNSSAGAANGHGFEIAFTYNLNKWFGIKGDFSTHFSTMDLDAKDSYAYSYPDNYYYDGYNETYTRQGSAEMRQYTYLFGPEFSLRKYEKFRPFAHFLVGFQTVDVHKLDVMEDTLREWTSEGSVYSTDHYDYRTTGKVKGTSFAMTFGGGVDIKLSDRVSLRIPQVDYIIPTLRTLSVDVTEKHNDYNSDDSVYYTYTEKWDMKVPTSRFHNVRVSTGLVFTW
jgi:opacity protein-like surface antigen